MTSAAEPFIFCAARPLWAHDRQPGRRAEDRAPWRWISFDRAAARIGQWRRRLQDASSGDRVAIAGSPSVEALMADLAARSLGLVVVHLRATEVARTADGSEALRQIAGVRILLDAAGPGSGEREMESVGLERRRLPDGADRDDGSIESDADGAVPAAGGCIVRDSLGVDREIGLEGLTEAVRRLESLVGEGRGRDVMVHGRSLAEPSERLLVEWAVRRAAAVIIPTGGVAAVGDLGRAAFELRPSLLHGSARDLAEWAANFERAEGSERGVRKRFAALRWVIVTGSEELRHSVTSFYARLGATVVSFDDVWLLEGDRLSSSGSAT